MLCFPESGLEIMSKDSYTQNFKVIISIVTIYVLSSENTPIFIQVRVQRQFITQFILRWGMILWQKVSGVIPFRERVQTP